MTQRRPSYRRRKHATTPWLACIVIAAVLASLVVKAKCSSDTASQPTSNSSTLNPEIDLTYVATNPQLQQTPVSYPGMDISFNPELHIPNWAAWELTGAETQGSEPRENKFYCDENVEGCPEHYDYSYSGYDRGHMVPAGDMKWSADAMHSSFSLVNICPQAKSLNTGAWKSLEEKCRKWAVIDSAIIIVCGPVLTDKITEYIGDSRVAVPQRFFKVILAPYADPIRGIGFIMPNGKVPGGMQAAAVSIDEVERITGHDFFSALPDEIEDQVEQQCDFHYWSTHKTR